MDILAKNMNFTFLLFFSIVIPIVIFGAERDWWAKKKIVFLGIILIIIPNNNFGQSSGLNEANVNFSLLIVAWSTVL